jgi:4-hydroxythreonine-4-phosphate dehydrogenase
MDTKIKIGITQGDFNGIGIEVMLKTLADSRINEMLTPIIYGSQKIVAFQKKYFELSDLSINLVRSTDALNHKLTNFINCYDREVKIEFGNSSSIAGEVAFISLETAVKDIKAGNIDAIVTAPINKYNIQSESFKFPGHTDYLAKQFNVATTIMLMVHDSLRIAVASDHLPINQVPKKISSIDTIFNKILLLKNSLEKDFVIRQPKIAVLGLNPHAGDNGIIGSEEQDFIIPAIKKAFDNKNKKFDAILAMYHDQGLMPFKILTEGKGVNFTAGLPIVRTSPAHGTAYDIAGKNLASSDSFREAIYLAYKIYNNRMLYNEITKNPLKSEKIAIEPSEE